MSSAEKFERQVQWSSSTNHANGMDGLISSHTLFKKVRTMRLKQKRKRAYLMVSSCAENRGRRQNRQSGKIGVADEIGSRGKSGSPTKSAVGEKRGRRRNRQSGKIGDADKIGNRRRIGDRTNFFCRITKTHH